MCIQVIQKKLSFKNLKSKSKNLKYRSKMHHGSMTCGYNVTRLKMGGNEEKMRKIGQYIVVIVLSRIYMLWLVF